MKNKIEKAAEIAIPITDDSNEYIDFINHDRKIWIKGAKWGLSQQEPIKGVEELRENLVAEIYSLIPNRVNNNAHATQIAESIIECLEPYLRTNNTQSDAVEFKNYVINNFYRTTKGYWHKGNFEKSGKPLNLDAVFSEFQNSKGIKQTNNNSISINSKSYTDYDITK